MPSFLPLCEYDDAALTALAANGSREAEEELVRRYSRLVRSCARPYTITGWGSDDFIQEGMIGLIRAIRDFDIKKSPSFSKFAELCIRSQLYSAVRSALREKHGPMQNYISLQSTVGSEEDGFLLVDTLPISSGADIEALYMLREEASQLLSELRCLLSVFETKVLRLYLEGLSLREISSALGKPQKSIDNALQRIRKKADVLRRGPDGKNPPKLE